MRFYLLNGGVIMKKIVFVPLDSRPCNTTWLQKFSKRSKLDLVMYPQNLCGSLYERSNQLAIMAFMINETKDADYLLVSLDSYCSGGLVQSRLGDFDVEATKKMMDVFKKIKLQNPDIKIYAFDTLMRTTVTSYGYETAILWRQINMYSKLKGSLDIKYDEHIEKELLELIKEINPNDLKRYIGARVKKFAMNEFYIDLVNENIIDYLTIIQEDAVSNGIQIIEQKKLFEKIAKLNLNDKIKLYNGTDEAASTLFAKIIAEAYKLKPKMYVESNNHQVLNEIFPFEDRPFKTNLDNLFDVIGITYASECDSDFVLAIFADDSTRNISLNDTKPVVLAESEMLAGFAKRVNKLIRLGNNVAFLDLSFPNGGNDDLLKRLDYLDLKAYSAWNTATNSTGSLLCDMLCVLIGDTSKTFLKERIMDDCIYQYIVRRKINEYLLRENINMFNLGACGDDILSKVRSEMEKYKDVVKADFDINLPWNRTFEIEINVRDKNEV